MTSTVPVSTPSPWPDLLALQAFVTVCQLGSMSSAAVRLGVSRSAVSQRIKALEAVYGLPLFDRDLRPAQPTRAGRELARLAGDLLDQARTLHDALRASARQDIAHIRLGCVDSFAATVGPALIRALSGSARQIQMWSGLTPALGAQLHGRELDLAVCTELRIDGARLQQRPLCAEEWVLVLPRAGPAGRVVTAEAPATARALAAQVGGLPLIRYSQRSVIGQQIEALLRHLGLSAPRRFEFDATDPLLSLVAAGLGWAVSTPLCLWQSRQHLPQVTVLPLPPTPLGPREFFLLSREGEWPGLAGEVQRVARQVIAHDLAPAIAQAMPALPATALRWGDEPRARHR